MRATLRGAGFDKPGEVRAALRGAGFHAGLIQANVRRLKRLVGGLGSAPTRSRWTDYAHALPYTETERAEKAAFVRQVVHARDRTMVWDLGCNTGAFARIAAERAGTVVAMDSDPRVVEALYQALKEEGTTGILSLVGDVSDPSPDRGWRGAERRSPERRGAPELVLVLALVHHLVVGASIPLPEVMAWLASFGAAVIVEFVDREDPMVRALLDAKAERYDDYDRHRFERHLSEAFETKARKVLELGHPHPLLRGAEGVGLRAHDGSNGERAPREMVTDPDSRGSRARGGSDGEQAPSEAALGPTRHVVPFLGARASCPQRAEGPRLFRRAGCPQRAEGPWLFKRAGCPQRAEGPRSFKRASLPPHGGGGGCPRSQGHLRSQGHPRKAWLNYKDGGPSRRPGRW